MRFFSTLASASLLATQALCETPTGYKITVNEHLGIGYNSTNIIPNQHLSMASVVKTPSIFTNNSYSGNYMLTLIDLDVLTNSTGLNLSTPGSLAQGLASNRTTHLHWFVTNVTEDSKGILAPHSGNGSRQVATYAAPSPPKGDINHTYVMFLWNQPKTYTLPKNNTYGTATNTSRNNFSVSALVAKVGNPVAANYFRVSYDNTIKNTTTTSKSAGVMSVKIDSLSTFVVAGFGAVAFAFLL